MQHFLKNLAVTGSVAILAASAQAAVFSDNFNDGADLALAGQVADTGQTWTNLTLWANGGGGLGVNPVYGTNGTPVAGSGTADAGNSVELGTTVTSGVVTLDLDFENPGAYNTPQFWLGNASGSANASLTWRADTGQLGWEGLSYTSFMSDTDEADNTNTSLVRSLHITLTVDIDAKTFAFSWFDNADPGDATTSGSFGPQAYTPTFEPSRFHLYRNGGNANFYSGFDNVVIEVPEPASLGLIALLGLVRRRSR